MHSRPTLALAALLLLACNRNEPAPSAASPSPSAGPPPPTAAPPAAEQNAPWPPPGAAAAPAPPEVTRLMERVAEGLSTRNGAEVSRYFITDVAFRVVSDCDPGVPEQVAQGRDEAAKRAQKGAATVFGRFSESYLLEVKEGQKPGPCRARQDVALFQGRYEWTVGGSRETGEAHFLRVNGIWFLVKL